MDKYQIKTHNTDILIIGTGGAGLTAAINAARCGFKVIALSKVHPLHSHTVAAQGGINASLGNITKDDPKWHMYDTIKASDWIADQDIVEIMCTRAEEAIKDLMQIGVAFDLTDKGMVDQKLYGGQSTKYGAGELVYRACYSADRTGHTIMNKLYEIAASKELVTFFNYNFALDLLMLNNRCYGVVSIDLEHGKINIIYAKHTIIATGGYSQIYQTSTSSSICSGDGNGLAFRAGINLQDMEFIQFHPTALNEIGVLITEAARSAGGKLLNGKNERFMSKYAPKFMELASRDIIARSIATEILNGNGVGINRDHVWLDLTHLTKEYIKHNLPTIFENCEKFLKLDPSKELIPVAPAAHYTMGGIPTDKHCRVINSREADHATQGLYAIGEAACLSAHGAGRLGCNSLLDLVVFGKLVVETIADTPLTIDNRALQDLKCYEQNILAHFNTIFSNKTIISIHSVIELKMQLKSLMQKYVGVFRKKQELEIARQLLEDLIAAYKNFKILDNNLQWNDQLKGYLELDNMLISAKATIAASLWRNESRGSHFRDDYPKRNDDQYLTHSIYSITGCFKRKVRKLAKYKDIFKPAERSY